MDKNFATLLVLCALGLATGAVALYRTPAAAAPPAIAKAVN